MWRARGILGALVVALLGAAVLRAQEPGIRAEAKADHDRTTLSGTVRVTLTLEGPAPLRVELPKQLLTTEANPNWRIRADGPASITPATNGRDVWHQVYRLDPYVEGAPLIVSFNRVTVNGNSQVEWNTLAVTVSKTVSEANPSAARPVTPPEDVPAPPAPPAPRAPTWAVIAFGLLGLVALIGVRVWKRRPKPVPPGERALAALAELDASGLDGAERADRIASILRVFVEHRFAVPATKLTTTELAAMTRVQEWPVERVESLDAILNECDRAKFAGDVPADGGRHLVRRAADWVAGVGTPPAAQ